MSEFDFTRAVFVHATELARVPLFYFVKTAGPLCKVNPRKTNARLQIAAMARRRLERLIIDSRLKRVFLEEDINNPQPVVL